LVLDPDLSAGPRIVKTYSLSLTGDLARLADVAFHLQRILHEYIKSDLHQNPGE